MNWLRFVFITALLVIFVVSTIAALFGAGKVLNALFRAYVFKVEICDYRPPKIVRPMSLDGKVSEVTEEQPKDCKIDFNRSKEDISDGLAMFIIAAPLALIFFKKIKKYIYES